MTGLELIVPLLGTAVSAAGTIISAQSASNNAKAQADQLEMKAQEEKAVAQREAIRKNRETELILSRNRAISAASGGGARDPSVMQLVGDIAAEGSYQQRAALYEGNTKANFLNAEASALRMRARQDMLAGFIGAGSTVLSGLSGWAKYQDQPTYAGTGYYY